MNNLCQKHSWVELEFLVFSAKITFQETKIERKISWKSGFSRFNDFTMRIIINYTVILQSWKFIISIFTKNIDILVPALSWNHKILKFEFSTVRFRKYQGKKITGKNTRLSYKSVSSSEIEVNFVVRGFRFYRKYRWVNTVRLHETTHRRLRFF